MKQILGPGELRSPYGLPPFPNPDIPENPRYRDATSWTGWVSFPLSRWVSFRLSFTGDRGEETQPPPQSPPMGRGGLPLLVQPIPEIAGPL